MGRNDGEDDETGGVKERADGGTDLLAPLA